MDYTTLILISIAIYTLVIIGLLLNVFIVTNNFIWWQKGHTLQTVDIIVTSLGAVRIILLILWLFDAEIANLVKDSFEYLAISTLSLEFCSLWWGTVLCVFYCVKITNYSNRLFLRLKMKISRLVPWLLLTSMMVSVLSSLPCVWFVYSVRHMNSTHFINGISDGNITLEINYTNIIIINFGGSFIPFLIFGAAISLLIVSLLKHTRNMNSKDVGFTKPQIVAHIMALINMSSFLFLYVLFFTGLILMPLTCQLQNPLYNYLYNISYVSYPSLHSVMLIVSNRNLKRSILAVLCCVRKIDLH
ncbi:taste receptor type 2 member 40-like [Mixophyes fleayi]|uniref:taste receptor type 2 member 40-like n=1 Tax=Mixophyes fleayi TaxID=3061075 RepID=UPI003F4E2748